MIWLAHFVIEPSKNQTSQLMFVKYKSYCQHFFSNNNINYIVKCEFFEMRLIKTLNIINQFVFVSSSYVILTTTWVLVPESCLAWSPVRSTVKSFWRLFFWLFWSPSDSAFTSPSKDEQHFVGTFRAAFAKPRFAKKHKLSIIASHKFDQEKESDNRRKMQLVFILFEQAFRITVAAFLYFNISFWFWCWSNV